MLLNCRNQKISSLLNKTKRKRKASGFTEAFLFCEQKIRYIMSRWIAPVKMAISPATRTIFIPLYFFLLNQFPGRGRTCSVFFRASDKSSCGISTLIKSNISSMISSNSFTASNGLPRKTDSRRDDISPGFMGISSRDFRCHLKPG